MSRSQNVAEWTFNIVILVFATSTIAQPFVIPSSSMESTLMTGDHVIVDKLAYAPAGAVTRHVLPYEEIRRGDIIVFRFPLDLSQNYVKRVIGLPGDRIRIENKQVFRNGEKLKESYAQHIFAQREPYRDDFPSAPGPMVRPRAMEMLANSVRDGELVVPAASLFALGDNRDNSLDSRYWGFVPRENVVGKPVIVFWSYDAPSEDLMGYSVHHVVDLAAHFFTKTRWNRTFRLVKPS